MQVQVPIPQDASWVPVIKVPLRPPAAPLAELLIQARLCLPVALNVIMASWRVTSLSPQEGAA